MGEDLADELGVVFRSRDPALGRAQTPAVQEVVFGMLGVFDPGDADPEGVVGADPFGDAAEEQLDGRARLGEGQVRQLVPQFINLVQKIGRHSGKVMAGVG